MMTFAPLLCRALPRTLLLPALLGWGATGIPLAALHAQAADPVDAAIETITEASVSDHLEFLAADALRGRDTPSPGLAAAADYLESHHRIYGLEPAGEDSTYLQRYPYRLMGPDPASARVTFVSPDGRVELAAGRDAFLDGGSTTPIEAPVHLLSLSAASAQPDPGSLADRVAAFRLPGDWDQELWRRSLDQAAFARAGGANAVIHVLDSSFTESLVPQLSEALSEPAWRLGGDAFLPRIFLTADAAGRMFESRGAEWPAAGSTASGTPVPGLTLEASLPPRVVVDGEPPNVLARIPGSDPELRDEYVVLSAHFDHVGVGRAVDGDSIYNGADDNGSGTTALLEVARVLASLPESRRPRRTVVFAHVSGEEKGLLGSQWWVNHPTVPLERVVANLNTDMIGGNTHPDTVAVLGMDYSTLGPLVQGIGREREALRITTVGDLWPGERLFFRSDQYNFMREGIPSLFFFAGFHDCYHRPCDEIDFVNPDKVARVARLLAYTVLEIANSNDRPAWNPGGWEEVQEILAGS